MACLVPAGLWLKVMAAILIHLIMLPSAVGLLPSHNIGSNRPLGHHEEGLLRSDSLDCFWLSFAQAS